MKYEDAGVVVYEVLRRVDSLFDKQQSLLWQNLNEDGNTREILRMQIKILTPCLQPEKKQRLQKIEDYLSPLGELVGNDEYSPCICRAVYIEVRRILLRTAPLLSSAEKNMHEKPKPIGSSTSAPQTSMIWQQNFQCYFQ